MKANDIVTCLMWKKDRVPTFAVSPLVYFAGAFVLILISAFIVAMIPELRPRVMWLPTNDTFIPKLLSKLVVLYPITIVMGLFNPSKRQLTEFSYHWLGVESICKSMPFTSYSHGYRKEVNLNEIARFGNMLKNYFSKNFNLSIIARNHRIYTYARKAMFWMCNLAIVAGLIYVGYILGILYHRTFSSSEIESVTILVSKLLWAPIVGIIIQYILVHIMDVNSMWVSELEYDADDTKNTLKYMEKYNLTGELNDEC